MDFCERLLGALLRRSLFRLPELHEVRTNSRPIGDELQLPLELSETPSRLLIFWSAITSDDG